MSLADCVYTYPHPAHRDSIIDCPGVPFPAYDQPDSDQVAVQNMLDEATHAFAVARPGAERIEVISGMLAAWYAAWPASAVTDEHEGIARHLAALIDEAEARAVACPCLPGAPAHRHGVGGYSTDPEPARTIAAGRPFRWDPAENCYCGGSGQTHPHRHGNGPRCRHTGEQEG